jgi:hypothetical protein
MGIRSYPVRKSVTRRISRLLAGDTLAARNGLEYLYLFAVPFDQMADVDDAIGAGVGALEAGVMRLYSVVVILSRWVRVGCARLCGVHSCVPTFLWAGLRGVAALAGPFLYPTCSLYRLFVVCTPFVCRLW